MVWISLVLNGSSTFARKRRTTTSTTFVSVLNPISHTCSAISARDTTSPAERTRCASRRNSFGARFPDHFPAVLMWQHDIDDKKIKFGRARLLQAALTIARKIDSETGFAESFGQESRCFLFVLDNENPHCGKYALF